MKEFSTIVFSGGAFKAISLVGITQFLEENNLIKNIKNLIGSSAGAVFCYMLCLNYSYNDMKQILYKMTNQDEYLKFDFEIEDLINMYEKFGLDSGERLELFFQNILYQKLYRKDITFLEFAKITGKNLVICVTNLTNICSEYWSVDTKPNYSIITALKASCCIPIVFEPIKIDDMLYIDGGLYNNCPISYLNKNNIIKDALVININCDNYSKMDNFFHYIRFIIASLIDKLKDKEIENAKNNTENIITLDLCNEENITFDDMKVILTKELIDKYITIGYDAIKHQLKIN